MLMMTEEAPHLLENIEAEDAGLQFSARLGVLREGCPVSQSLTKQTSWGGSATMKFSPHRRQQSLTCCAEIPRSSAGAPEISGALAGSFENRSEHKEPPCSVIVGVVRCRC